MSTPRVGPVGLIGLAAILNVVSGVLLKEAGRAEVVWVIPIAIAMAGVVNLVRFFLWRSAHQRYPLSLTYPLTGLTFPIALLVSSFYGETVGVSQVLAMLLISFGVVMIHRSEDESNATN